MVLNPWYWTDKAVFAPHHNRILVPSPWWVAALIPRQGKSRWRTTVCFFSWRVARVQPLGAWGDAAAAGWWLYGLSVVWVWWIYPLLLPNSMSLWSCETTRRIGYGSSLSLSVRWAHLLFHNILTKIITDPLTGSSMRSLNSTSG